MNIKNRIEKPESIKKIKEITMFLIFLDEGAVYDYEIGLDCKKEFDRRTFQRYAKDLYEIGAIPKLRIKSKKIIESDILLDTLYYYEAPSVMLTEYKQNIEVYNEQLKMNLKQFDVNLPMYRNRYNPIKHINKNVVSPSLKRLSRVICMIYFDRCYINVTYKNGTSRHEKYYFDTLNKGASKKTWERDKELFLYATYNYHSEIENIRKKYQEYLKKIRKH